MAAVTLLLLLTVFFFFSPFFFFFFFFSSSVVGNVLLFVSQMIHFISRPVLFSLHFCIALVTAWNVIHLGKQSLSSFRLTSQTFQRYPLPTCPPPPLVIPPPPPPPHPAPPSIVSANQIPPFCSLYHVTERTGKLGYQFQTGTGI